MKILVIDEWLPWPLDSGKKIRSFNLMRHLAKEYEIYYQAYVNLPQEEEKVEVMKSHGIHVIPVEDVRTSKWTLRFYFEVIINMLSAKPFSTAYHIKDAFRKKMRETVAQLKPDLIHCEWTNLAPFLENYKNIPRVIAVHNVESDIWKRLATNGSNFFVRFLGKQQAKKIEILERKWYQEVDHCIAVSQEDKQVIESYNASVTLVENGVDLEFYKNFKSNVDVDKNMVVFVSSLDTFSNQDGVDYFVKNIFPILKKNNPDVSFWIVGKNPTKKIKTYAKKYSNIVITGTVPDVREYISKAAICVVPLRIGGGSRLKILEAMAMRKLVISTSIGAEGLRVKDGVDIILADKPEDFAAKVLELQSNPDLQKRLGDAGWKLVELNYDWGRLAEKQSNVWRERINTTEGII